MGSVSPIVGSVIEIVGLSLQKWGCAERPIPMSALQLQCRPMPTPLLLHDYMLRCSDKHMSDCEIGHHHLRTGSNGCILGGTPLA